MSILTPNKQKSTTTGGKAGAGTNFSSAKDTASRTKGQTPALINNTRRAS